LLGRVVDTDDVLSGCIADKDKYSRLVISQ
jgi:hypothetical protein